MDDKTLALLAQKLRAHCLRSTTAAGSGHPTTCLSAADVVSCLFFRTMKLDPFGENTDAFVLSKGHAAPLLYAALFERGLIHDDLLALRKMDSPLEGHPTPRCRHVLISTGSLGQGLSAATGMAVARKIDGRPERVYCLLGDGECAEGSVWEAVQFAAFNKLDNLCAVVDVNGLGQSGPTMFGHDAAPLARRFEAFGWNAVAIDGHDISEINRALDAARDTRGRPTAIVARTVKGKGVSFLEGKEGWHGKPVPKADLEKALAEIGDTRVEFVAPEGAKPSSIVTKRRVKPAVTTDYALGAEVATREAYGSALVKLGAQIQNLVVLDGDVKNSTYAEKFKAAHPDRFIESYIAEQQMVGAALGLAAEGKIPFASTFAAFLTRAFDQIRMAAYSRPGTLVLCGSHAGVSIGEDGPSQMGLEDLAMFRAIFDSKVLYPSDAVSAEKLVAEAAAAAGVTYLRTSRPKTKVLYRNDEAFPIGGSKVLRTSGHDVVTIVGAGVTLHEALAAHDLLAKDGVRARVIDLYSVKPIDAETLRKAWKETRAIVTVEDHSIHGGLGEAVAHAVPDAIVTILGVREVPQSATPAQLLRKHGIDAESIAAAVKRVLAVR